MKGVFTWALFSCALAACVWGPSDTQETARSKLTTLEKAWVRALTAGDLQVLDDLSDHDLTYVAPDGHLLTKAELLSYAKSTHPQKLITGITKVQVFEDTAVVNGTYQSTEFKNGKTLVREGQFTDTWFHRGSSWVCIVAQATPVLEPGR